MTNNERNYFYNARRVELSNIARLGRLRTLTLDNDKKRSIEANILTACLAFLRVHNSEKENG